MTSLSRIGAAGFALWALLHLVGGGMILAATLSGGAEAGYALYGPTDTGLPRIAGDILAYFAYLLMVIALVVAGIAATLNRANSEIGLAINTGVVLVTEIGLILFLLVPGHVPVLQALPGFVLFGIGAIAGGMACRGDAGHA